MMIDMEILRTGSFKASNGREVSFTDEDLDRIAAAYDPGFHEAPATIGHPEDNRPAYGWVKGLKSAGGRLVASLDLVPEMLQAVKEGLFRKRSASVYADLDGKGPYLRHVAFLGAMPPAVKALADINLADDGKEFVSVEFSEEKKMSWKEKMKALFGQAVDEIPEGPSQTVVVTTPPPAVSFSEDEVRSREEAAAKKAKDEAHLEFAEKTRKMEAEQAAAARKADLERWMDGMVEKGVVLPAWVKSGMHEFMETLPFGDAVIELSEGKKLSPIEWFQRFVEELPKAVDFSEVAGRDKDAGSGSASARLDQLTRKKMEAEKTLSFSEAFGRVQRENPDLAREYADSLRG